MQVVMARPAIAIALERGEALSLKGARGFHIVGESGTVWVTQECCDVDHIVGPGDRLTLTMTGRTVVEALSAAVVRIAQEIAAVDAAHAVRHRGFRTRSPSAPSVSTR
jgi:hypothetical protein